MQEKEVGVITHYFGRVCVGIIHLKELLNVGDTIRIKGTHDDFSQTVESMPVDHKAVIEAKKGDDVGIKVNQKVHVNDKVYKVVE